MKKGKSTELNDTYWDGNSSLKEERSLKEKEGTAYFGGLKKAKEDTMDWSFDDFLADVKKQDMPRPIAMSRRLSFRIWSYGAAAVVVLLVGLLYIQHQRERQGGLVGVMDTGILAQKSVIRDVSAPQKKEKQIVMEVNESSQESNDAKRLLAANRPHMSTTVKATDQKASGISKADIAETYVFVNGQPVYDEDEAEEIALVSLKIMVNNFREGKEALEKMKHIKIEL